ncbi:CHAP domain-containing protein [Actinomadura sp. KC06]|uniref:peptidoglycan-binding domain-containing protein n=1 Tax=Actinomadura sp. KC06 TaxID=2530369 RepID=UPI0010489997|nr:peptidoglycan-binding protein [Actinomadura sp. KC06]TDD25061.1 CHAP domain-containing protein [Actinomadura sp. KC06]
MSAAGMLAEARKSIGMAGRPNRITKEYAERHGDEFLRAAWCDMAITYWARHSGNTSAVLPGGDRAYTVWHADDFRKAGRWFSGTTANVDQARAGDIVFFDWGATNAIGAIDHVGIVEKVLGGGRLQTIEANTGDAVRRRIRSSSVIAGYGRPDYASAGSPKPPASKPATSKVPRWPGRYLTQPPIMSGADVRTWQARMKARGWRIDVDGAYGPGSESICRAFQREKGLSVDGVVGPATWRAAWTAQIT